MAKKYTTKHDQHQLATILEALADKYRETGEQRFKTCIVNIFIDTGVDPPAKRAPSSRTLDCEETPSE